MNDLEEFENLEEEETATHKLNCKYVCTTYKYAVLQQCDKNYKTHGKI